MNKGKHGMRKVVYTRNGVPFEHQAWADISTSRGVVHSLDESHSGRWVETTTAGQTEIINVDGDAHSISPILNRSTQDHEHLLVQIVRGGRLSIEQRSHSTVLKPGDIAVLDPQYMFTVSMRERTQFSALRIPKSALRMRGLTYTLPTMHCPISGRPMSAQYAQSDLTGPPSERRATRAPRRSEP